MNSFIILINILFKCLLIIIILLITSIIKYKDDNLNLFDINNKNAIKNFVGNIGDANFSLYFNLSLINYFFSYKFNKVELEYYILFFDQENNIIIPSELALYYNLHMFCLLNVGNTTFQSITNFYQNEYFYCLEYFELKQQTKLGIKICDDTSKCLIFDLFGSEFLNFNHLLLLNDDKFDFNYLKKQNLSFFYNITSNQDKDLLEKTYFLNPLFSTKEKAIRLKNTWYFKNIYNHYFCYCKGDACPSNKKFDNCKYYLYLSIIDNFKDLYKKNYYLLLDFLYSNRAPGDAFFLFREMVKHNMSAYYLTERKDIYQEYYDNKTKLQKVIPIINKQYNITGIILEKYLSLFLKLKSVISGSEFFSKENIFFIINYITFICLGHGVNYFKPFLYEDYYGCKRYNKIILPSDKIISIAKKYGWKKRNIIKLGLPKWDLFYNYSIKMRQKEKEKCIFMMFTWRKLREKKNNQFILF